MKSLYVDELALYIIMHVFNLSDVLRTARTKKVYVVYMRSSKLYLRTADVSKYVREIHSLAGWPAARANGNLKSAGNLGIRRPAATASTPKRKPISKVSSYYSRGVGLKINGRRPAWV